MKYLVVGLGNIGAEYEGTRHNAGFDVVDKLVEGAGGTFAPDRYASKAEVRWKGRTLVVIKPSTYMNLSGKAVRYWMDKENIARENLIVIVDDIAIPVGTLRIRAKGSDGGHNGLKKIVSPQVLPRLKVGARLGSSSQPTHSLLLFCLHLSSSINTPRANLASNYRVAQR